jgi:hypothetical protein
VRTIWLRVAGSLMAALAVAGGTAALADNPAPTVRSAASPASGYWLIAADGNVYPFGDASFHGSLAGVPTNRPVAGAVATPTGQGYWLVGVDGGVFSFGDARFFGSMGDKPLNRPIVGMTATPSGNGYWFVASDGGIFAFGDARFFGSMGDQPLNRPIVGMTATPSGNGYWLVASDGGIFAFGDAPFHGSMGAKPLNKPIVGMTGTPSGRGYRFVASDGGIFAFGDAGFFGSVADGAPARRIVGMAASPTGNGYWLVGVDGAVYNFGDAPFSGQADGPRLPAAITAMAAAPAPSNAPGGEPGGHSPTGQPAPPDSSPPVTVPPAQPFDIALIGDTGYSHEQDEKLIRTRKHMNGFNLSFIVHDGDIKDQLSPCTDDRLDYVRDVFNGFAAPFVFTPGDNEWSDCSDPGRQLADIRRLFFPTDQSLGQRRITVTRQSPPFIENARWTQGNVVFATVNLPGPEGTGAKGIGAAAVNWVNQAFDQAEASGSPGLMIIWQDDPWDGPREGTLMDTLEDRTEAFGRPVVLVHGDTHVYRLDHPWPDVPNFTRLETYALEDTDKWVRVTVDPTSPQVFNFTTMRAR